MPNPGKFLTKDTLPAQAWAQALTLESQKFEPGLLGSPLWTLLCTKPQGAVHSGQPVDRKAKTPTQPQVRKPPTLTCTLGPAAPPHSSGLSGRLRRPVLRSQVFSPERTSRGPQVHVQPIHRPFQQEIFSFELSGGLPWGGPGPGSRLTVGAGKAKRSVCGPELPGQQVRAPQGGGQERMPRTRPRMRAAAERTGAPREPLQEPPAGRTLAAGALGGHGPGLPVPGRNLPERGSNWKQLWHSGPVCAGRPLAGTCCLASAILQVHTSSSCLPLQ